MVMAIAYDSYNFTLKTTFSYSSCFVWSVCILVSHPSVQIRSIKQGLQFWSLIIIDHNAWCSQTTVQRVEIHPVSCHHAGKNAFIRREIRRRIRRLIPPNRWGTSLRTNISQQKPTWSKASQNKQLLAFWSRWTAVDRAWQLRIR